MRWTILALTTAERIALWPLALGALVAVFSFIKFLIRRADRQEDLRYRRAKDAENRRGARNAADRETGQRIEDIRNETLFHARFEHVGSVRVDEGMRLGFNYQVQAMGKRPLTLVRAHTKVYLGPLSSDRFVYEFDHEIGLRILPGPPVPISIPTFPEDRVPPANLENDRVARQSFSCRTQFTILTQAPEEVLWDE